LAYHSVGEILSKRHESLRRSSSQRIVGGKVEFECLSKTYQKISHTLDKMMFPILYRLKYRNKYVMYLTTNSFCRNIVVTNTLVYVQSNAYCGSIHRHDMPVNAHCSDRCRNMYWGIENIISIQCLSVSDLIRRCQQGAICVVSKPNHNCFVAIRISLM